jgi:hypothetical protein
MKCIGRWSLVVNAVALCGFVAALPTVVSASTKIIVCSSCDPIPVILTETNGALGDVQATAAAQDGGDLTVEYLNLTGSIIDDLVFSTTIATGLDPTKLQQDGDFECAAPDGYFLQCSVDYDPTTGQLTYAYYDVNPPNIYDTPGFVIWEDLNGLGSDNTGIPEGGLFEISLSGWTTSLSDPNYINPATGLPEVLYSTPPTLSNSFNVPVPEASTVLILLTELLFAAAALVLFRRRLNWKTRFEL